MRRHWFAYLDGASFHQSTLHRCTHLSTYCTCILIIWRCLEYFGANCKVENMLCVISDSFLLGIRTSEPTWKYDVSWVAVKNCQKTCRTKVKTIQIPVICRDTPPLWPTFPEIGETHNLSCGRHGSWSSLMLEEKKSSKMSGLSIWTEQLESWIVWVGFW